MDLIRAAWRKSSYSGNNGGACVEIATIDKPVRIVAVRDSKNPDGPKLVATLVAWRRFADHVKADAVGQR